MPDLPLANVFSVSGGNPTLAFLWAERAAGPYNLLHSGFGLGAAIGPLISRPFLASDSDASGLNYTNDVISNGTTNASLASRIEYPYLFVGILCLLVAMVFVGFYVARSGAPTIFIPTQEETVSKILSPGRCAGGSNSFGCQMLALIFIYYMVVVGGERTYGKFLFSFSIHSELKFSRVQATWLNSAYWISYTAARLATAAAARWLPIHLLIFGQVFGTLGAAIGLDVFRRNAVAFWLFSSALGFFRSPLFPSGLGWANRYMEVTSMTITCVNVGSSIGGMTMQWLTGFLFEYYGPTSFVHVVAINSVLVCAVFIVMHQVARRHGERYLATDDATVTASSFSSMVQLSKYDRKPAPSTSCDPIKRF